MRDSGNQAGDMSAYTLTTGLVRLADIRVAIS